MGSISRNIEDYKKINEASYLTADQNVTRYRIILRFFFVQHERMKDFLYPNEILEHAQSILGQDNYTEDALQQDLQQLTKWKNIIPTQELRNPRSISEFNKKTFRYQIASYTVQIERMLVQLEKAGAEFQGSLDKRPFEKLLFAIRDFFQSDEKEPLAEKWYELTTNFTRIRENTADYLAYLNSAHAEENMQKESFLVYKDTFVGYLRDFILGSHQTASKIQSVIEEVRPDLLDALFTRLSLEENFTPRFEEMVGVAEDEKEELHEIWMNIKMWFMDQDGHLCEYNVLQSRTNETIRKITRNIKRIGERHQQHLSRRRDYLHLAKWFAQAESLEEAHLLSGNVFGIANTRHYQVEQSRTNDMYSDIWQEIPTMIELKPRTQGNHDRLKAGQFQMNTEAKQRAREEYEKEIEVIREQLQTYIMNGEIRLENGQFLHQRIRKLLLRWVSSAMMNESHSISTEYGYKVKVEVVAGERIRINSEDGHMELPTFIFHFDER